jgi:hypothetical protein
MPNQHHASCRLWDLAERIEQLRPCGEVQRVHRLNQGAALEWCEGFQGLQSSAS